MSAGPGTGVRRRSGLLNVTFESTVVTTAPGPLPLEIAPLAGALVVRGRLSSGSLGWVLSARAHVFRRAIAVEISARRPDGAAQLGVEDQAYTAHVSGLLSGRYLVRVNHIWLLDLDRGDLLVMPAWEGPVLLPSPRSSDAGL